MIVTFLGTSAGTPTRARNLSALAMQPDQRGTFWLFDCGEATQHQILRSPHKLSRLEAIFFTHLHGDHLFGLPGLLATRSMQEPDPSPLTLYGPEGLSEYVRVSLDRSGTHLNYSLRIETVTPGIVFQDSQWTIECAAMEHRIAAFGYAVIEADQPGTFNADKARALGIAPGPLYGVLKSGGSVTLPNGSLVEGGSLLGVPRRGRKVVYCGDTTYTLRAVALARNADLLIHEATHHSAQHDLAIRAAHSTAAMAARVAREAGVKRLLLTHFSPRYEPHTAPVGSLGLDDLLSEARAIFPNTHLAQDFLAYQVQRHDSGK